MSSVPGHLAELRDYLEGVTGLSPISLGIVGNTAHLSGYHLGRDRIFGSSGLGERDYSVQTRRDRSGLSDAASAMDIGSFSRGGRSLRDLSLSLVARARGGTADMADVREIIYSPDGRTVLRYDRERGVGSTPRPGEADNSHLTHTHLSWYRDAARSQLSPFRAYFTGGTADMGLDLTISDQDARGVLRLASATPALEIASGLPVTVPAGSVRRVHFLARRTSPDGTGYVIGNEGGKPLFVGRTAVPDGAFELDAPVSVPTGDVAAAIAERDREWRTFLLAGSPGEG